MKVKIEIDKESGFCFGVQNAVNLAEQELRRTGNLYSLGSIVHNQVELDRLKSMGLKVIDYQEFGKLTNVKVLIRAHGEPPDIYAIAHKNNIELIDATCPIVSKLQARIRTGYQKHKRIGGSVVIYGKKNHPEVRTLLAQTEGKAVVINSKSSLDKLDFSKSIFLYSQTTMNNKSFEEIISKIAEKISSYGGNPEHLMHINRTICKHVSNRESGLKEFSGKYDIILFVSSKESSNGRMLFKVCKSVNRKSFFITNLRDLADIPFRDASSIGICGATSTPQWFLEKIRIRAEELVAGL
jgi:4-hydroxy-3-methylbut-2-enyl diphosphate reductase